MTYSTPVALSSQLFHCSLPLRVDAYRGCSFACSYCFARNRGGQTRSRHVANAEPNALGRLLDRARSSVKVVSPVVEFLRARVPVHFGGMSDPFQPAELKRGVSKEFLASLRAHDYPTVISTRSPTITGVADLLVGMQVVVQFSLSTIDDKQAQLVEPMAPRPTAILEAMGFLAARGIPVSARWQPYIPGFSPPPDEFVDAVVAAGARQVSLEHLKVPTEKPWGASLKRASGVLQEKRIEYLKLGARRDGREFILPVEHKLATVLATRAICHKRGVAFGAADNEFQFLSDGNACCSGVDLIAGFSTVYRNTIPQVIKGQVAAGEEIHFKETASWRPTGSIDRYLNSKSRLDNKAHPTNRKVDYFMREKWNDDGFASPSSYFGIRPSGEVDADGMKIYLRSSELAQLLRG